MARTRSPRGQCTRLTSGGWPPTRTSRSGQGVAGCNGALRRAGRNGCRISQGHVDLATGCEAIRTVVCGLARLRAEVADGVVSSGRRQTQPVGAIVLVVAVIGGISFGVVTPTEAGGLGAVVALLLGSVVLRTINRSNIGAILIQISLELLRPGRLQL